MSREWWLVLAASVTEVGWVSGLKHSSTWWQWLLTVICVIFSFKVFLDAAAKLPIGTVYVVFTGLGTAGTVIAEIVVFGEPAKPLKLLFIAMLAAGVLGLKLVTKDGDSAQDAQEVKEGGD